MKNSEIAQAFEELGALYELDGAVVYRVLAYRNAAKAIRDAGVSVAELAKQGRVEELSGVGKTIAEKIDVLLETGSIPSADKLKAKIPAGLIEITRIPGLGPKRTRVLHEKLGIETLDDLREAAEDGRLRDVPGFGAKAEENVLQALAAGADGQPKPRVLLSHALEAGERLVEALQGAPGGDQGRARRQRAPDGGHLQGPRHRGRGQGPEGAHGGVRGAPLARGRELAGGGGRPGDDPQRHPRRPADRA